MAVGADARAIVAPTARRGDKAELKGLIRLEAANHVLHPIAMIATAGNHATLVDRLFSPSRGLGKTIEFANPARIDRQREFSLE
jgi:hypothetical protein